MQNESGHILKVYFPRPLSFHLICPQVAQARYMSSSMLNFALLRDSSDLHIYKDLSGERNKPEKNRKITVELQ